MGIRKKYFILKGLQIRIISIVVLIMLLVVAASIFNISFFGMYFLDRLDPIESDSLHQTIRIVVNKLWDKLLLLTVVNLILIFVVGIFFSHQIAGPIYKLKIIMERIAAGDLSLKIKFRKGDKVGELADYINHALNGICSGLIEINDSFEQVKRSFEEIPPDHIPAELKSQMAELEEKIKFFQLKLPD